MTALEPGSLLVRRVERGEPREPVFTLLREAGEAEDKAREWLAGGDCFALFDACADEGEQPVAAALTHLHPCGAVVLRTVVVAPEHRGQGLGRRLMAEVADALRVAGARRIMATTTAEDPAVCALYEKIGFWMARADGGKPRTRGVDDRGVVTFVQDL